MNMVENLKSTLEHGSVPAVMAAAVMCGAAASATSCAMVRFPVLWGYITSSADSKLRGLKLSAAFICGLIASYAAMGIAVGAFAGWASGLLSLSRYVYLSLGAALLAAGLMFAVLPPLFRHRASGRSGFASALRRNPRSAFVFGVCFALLEMPACPCCGAVLMVLAGFASMKGSPAYSGMMFSCFALGQALPLLMLGASAGWLRNIPAHSARMENTMTFAAGNVLMAVGAFLCLIA